MIALLYSLIALGIVAFVAGWLRNKHLRKQLQRGEIDEMPTIKQRRPDGCCGKHAVCEKDLTLQSIGKPIEYFEDEELDVFANRHSNAYSPEEVDQFEEVMTTMRPDEVQQWLHSLSERSINLPDELKDEAILLMEG